MKYLVTVIVFASSLTLASGWNCKAEGAGFPRAKVVNHTTNPRKPAVFVVSGRNGTIVSGQDNEITKRNLSNGVRYTTGDESYKAVLFVEYREGAEAPLENGETVYGKLILVEDDNSAVEKTYDMECARYLKNN